MLTVCATEAKTGGAKRGKIACDDRQGGSNLMPRGTCILLFGLTIVAASALPGVAQLLPEVAPKPVKPPAAKPAQIVVQTSPNAEVYLDDEYRGRASPEGRLVIANPKPGKHNLRLSLPGKKDFQQKITVVAGKELRVAATLTDLPGSILVTTAPGAEVSVDNLSRGAADANGQVVISDVGAGVHALRVTARGKKDFSQTVNVSTGHETRVDAALLDLSPPTSGEARESSKDGLKYVWIPPGSFMMGCSPGDNECFDNEKPSHQVTISKGFWMGQTEVTVGAYKRFAAATGRRMPPPPNFNSDWANENMPMVSVSWNDAREYCTWAGGRLPTEAEWEYAARGGSTEARYGNIDEIAWHEGNSGDRAHEVSQKRANGFGLFDALGNVWEWVNDWYDDKYYQKSPSQDPPGPRRGWTRVLRGGMWVNGSRVVRVSFRDGYYPDRRVGSYGLRCGRDVE
jgi:formylglycine-generating enzyme required for sulfatase activity